ncbi:4a-hydroxytetrahydrobiopterin dehydratase [Candidatus Chordibacter forsetii]|uniref:4a-hydroxytetrahydrobiopterin dehydratase n=1 Tax=Candidatus Chordibacter forsetii TaxID=3381758 RepID=UPI00236FEFC0|nr:4a-hydroxytetrahydrobiopterin dehydratase [Opitutales bacterium]
MNEVQITESLKGLPGWTFEDNKLQKKYKFNDFPEAMAFLVRLSYEAENRNHHPEIFNCYNRVELALNTHDAGGKVTELDFDLARAAENIF